jgi:hypothetical protein
MRNISEKVEEKIKTHLSCSIPPPPHENRALNEVTWKNMVEPDKPRMTIYHGARAWHAG